MTNDSRSFCSSIWKQTRRTVNMHQAHDDLRILRRSAVRALLVGDQSCNVSTIRVPEMGRLGWPSRLISTQGDHTL